MTARGDTASDVPPEISRKAEHAEQMEHLFRNELQVEGIEGEWHLLFPSETSAFIDLAKSFDLTILGQLSPETRLSGSPPDETVVVSGRPVLVIPYAGTFDRVGGRVLIAWDSSREAVRALHGALPLLGHADVVTVIYVAAQQASLEQRRPSLERISRHLQRQVPKKCCR